jgi:hypothetical protein
MTEYRHCLKCVKKVPMRRCEACKGLGRTRTPQCRSACNMHGWLYPTHGKHY